MKREKKGGCVGFIPGSVGVASLARHAAAVKRNTRVVFMVLPVIVLVDKHPFNLASCIIASVKFLG